MIADSLNAIKRDLPENVTLVAVSKTKPVSLIMEAYDAGQRVFGENKVQELVSKYEEMPKDIQWHMIGHLQTNKVKYIAPFVHLIHGVDSLKLLKEIDKQGKKHDRIIKCLLQFHIAEEETKFGFDVSEALEMLRSDVFKELLNIEIIGVMGMATFTDNETQIRKEFKHLKEIFEHLSSEFFKNASFNTISMGMSGDYKLAIEEGSTMVRVGSSIFGSRN
ncbi:MAG: YggS family pyridoxal phosphate-dependent enzyme [Bacteroidetes bacterium]|nr:MAG: YggS family pyridoxal phosphate-dependent enzyme [Bacteroidota bacterium]TNE99974.1 MAG: YggS family pyridoxal phosphate-dependent enzyme [Bacteroidota bacterium]